MKLNKFKIGLGVLIFSLMSLAWFVTTSPGAVESAARLLAGLRTDVTVIQSFASGSTVATGGVYTHGVTITALGQAPLTVDSDVLVTNLNSDKLDGQHWTDIQIAYNLAVTGSVFHERNLREMADVVLAAADVTYAAAATGYTFHTDNLIRADFTLADSTYAQSATDFTAHVDGVLRSEYQGADTTYAQAATDNAAHIRGVLEADDAYYYQAVTDNAAHIRGILETADSTYAQSATDYTLHIRGVLEAAMPVTAFVHSDTYARFMGLTVGGISDGSVSDYLPAGYVRTGIFGQAQNNGGGTLYAGVMGFADTARDGAESVAMGAVGVGANAQTLFLYNGTALQDGMFLINGAGYTSDPLVHFTQMSTGAIADFVAGGESITINNDVQIVSTHTGSAPFIVADSTVVTNLNADTVDGVEEATIESNAVGTAKIYTDGVTSSALVNAAHTLTLHTPVWNDTNLPIISAKHPGTGNPTWDPAFTANLGAYTFAVGDYVDLGEAEILHDYAEGTSVEIHVHIITNGANDGTVRLVRFKAFYSWGDDDEVMSAEGSVVGEHTIAAAEADLTHHIISLGWVNASTYRIGSVFKARITRIDCSTGGTEPAVDPFVEMAGIHYQVDSIGSRTKLVK
jgi:hypothetical protein